MYISSGWTAEEHTPEDIAWWYFDYANHIYTVSEKYRLFANPLGKILVGSILPTCTKRPQKPTLAFLPRSCAKENITALNMEAIFHHIPGGRGLLPTITLEDYDQQYDLLTLNVSVSQLEAPDRKMAPHRPPDRGRLSVSLLPAAIKQRAFPHRERPLFFILPADTAGCRDRRQSTGRTGRSRCRWPASSA